MSRKLRFIVLLLAIVIVAALASALVQEMHARNESDRLLREAAKLRIGTSTDSDVTDLAQRFHGSQDRPGSRVCGVADSCYVIQIGTAAPLNRLLLGRARLQRWVGLRPWATDAILQITSGKLSGLIVYVIAFTGVDREQLTARTELVSDQEGPANPGLEPYFSSYHIARGEEHVLDVRITPAASEGERERAFSFNLTCTLSYRGCRNVCQLMPSAWSYMKNSPFRDGTPLPPAEANDARCKDVLVPGV